MRSTKWLRMASGSSDHVLMKGRRIAGGAETLGQLKKSPFFSFAGFNPLLDEFDQYPVVAKAPALGHHMDLLT
jgi:hypothetical protein